MPFWNERCKTATQEKRRARNEMNRRCNLETCTKFRETKAKAQRTIREEQKQYWRSYCSTLNDESKMRDVWRTSKKMVGAYNNRGIPTIVEHNVKHTTNQDKANTIARCLAKNSSNDNFPEKFKERRKEAEASRKESEKSMVDTSPELNEDFVFHELDTALRSYKKNKSPGEDQLQYEMLQQLPKCSKKVVLGLFNKIWNNGKLPSNWKHSIILPFHKEGKNSADPNSYRPIALTATMCKTMEKLITNRLSWFLETNQLFNVDQAGFRRRRSTIDQIMKLQDDIIKAMNRKEYTIAIFIDFQKAFDMVWKTGILEKMQKLNITGRMYAWVKDFMEDRTFQVKVEGQLSSTFNFENGTPQGSVLSPVLFLIAINDFPDLGPCINKSIFADDSAIWKSGRNLKVLAKQMQDATEKIQNWCLEWGFSISTEKTIGMVFCEINKPDDVTISINNWNIKIEKKTKFLG